MWVCPGTVVFYPYDLKWLSILVRSTAKSQRWLDGKRNKQRANKPLAHWTGTICSTGRIIAVHCQKKKNIKTRLPKKQNIALSNTVCAKIPVFFSEVFCGVFSRDSRKVAMTTTCLLWSRRRSNVEREREREENRQMIYVARGKWTRCALHHQDGHYLQRLDVFVTVMVVKIALGSSTNLQGRWDRTLNVGALMSSWGVMPPLASGRRIGLSSCRGGNTKQVIMS